jgi:hypothetical protein
MCPGKKECVSVKKRWCEAAKTKENVEFKRIQLRVSGQNRFFKVLRNQTKVMCLSKQSGDA